MAIDEDTRARLVRAAKRQTAARAERDRLIREAHAQGGSLREIGRLADLTSAGVLRIIRNPPQETE